MGKWVSGTLPNCPLLEKEPWLQMGRALTASRTRPAARAKLPEIRTETGRHGYAGLLHPGGLARVGGGVRQLVIGDRPNVLDAAAGAQKQSGRSQRYKRHEQGILD